MNHNLWNAVGIRVLALSFVLAGLTACSERISDVSARKPAATAATPSAVVIGTLPAQSTVEPAGTTSVAGNTTEMTKAVERNSMPLPGQPNDHSNIARTPSQTADSVEVLKSPELAKQANSGERQTRNQ